MKAMAVNLLRSGTPANGIGERKKTARSVTASSIGG
jgi:hypothetical protein